MMSYNYAMMYHITKRSVEKMRKEILENNYYVVRSLAMTNYLVRKGFDIKKVDDNKANPEFKVFLFADSQELRDAMSEYIER